MTLQLFAHPFSSYCQKALIALYENDIAFEFRMLGPDAPDTFGELKAHWPIGKFPLLLDDGRPIVEASIIIEHLALHYPGPVRLIPDDPKAALQVRFWDRFFDNYIATPQQKFVIDALSPEGSRDPYGVERAGAMLDTAYAHLDRHMQGREWVAGETFSLADCAAAPQLFYADWTHPIGDRFPAVTAYRERLKARPSFARCIDEARPYRPLFPLGAPDRD
ncbi:glutathione S-transferase family protein [Jiella avicenniae]|uniref:Glutathione S-transferase family protein n=1 Tax=Jiella avicenniae TaxID=2907202 RepID=A0A9X1P1N8_9HYPH|nr:glutathione S-transferase family protein [Jiella avicenniae]MCE7029745.1 glutathione S-transferase family protein [Jiella avicenniae]